MLDQERLCGIFGCGDGIIVSVCLFGEIMILGRLPIWDKLDCKDVSDGPECLEVTGGTRLGLRYQW